MTPPECAREMAALLPRSELVWIAQCGHMLTLEKPAEVNAALGAWLHRLLQN